MSLRRPAAKELQPDNFYFSATNQEKAHSFLTNYPSDRKQSALLPLLHLAQEQEGWISVAAMAYIADFIEIPYIKVYEVVTFYTMFNLQPIGKYHLQVCTTTPCWLRGSDAIMATCKSKLNIKHGETSADQKFTLTEVECLGSCANAPIVQINNDYFEDLNAENFATVLDNLQNDKKVDSGSQTKRQASMPENYTYGNENA
jgi:NADH-quinone oxidoreductase E subunit